MAPPPPRTRDEILNELSDLAVELAHLDGEADRVRGQRTKVMLEGRAISIPNDALAQAAGISVDMVFKALRRARAGV